MENKKILGFPAIHQTSLYVFFFYSDRTNEKFASVLFPETEATYREAFNLPAFPHRNRVYGGFSRKKRKNIDFIQQNKRLRKPCKFLKNLCQVSHFLHIFPSTPIFPPWTKESTKKISKSFIYEVYNSYLAYNSSTARL